MKVYNIKISEDVMKEISETFYKQECLQKLVNNGNANETAGKITIEMYASAYTAWQSSMDKCEKSILDDIYKEFAYDYSMKFSTNEVVFTTEDLTMHDKLISLGFVFIKDLV